VLDSTRGRDPKRGVARPQPRRRAQRRRDGKPWGVSQPDGARSLRPAYRELETHRLTLRRPVEDDATRLFRAFGSDPEVTRFLTWRPHRSIADAEAAIAQRIQRLSDGTEYSWIVERAGHREAIGIVSAWFSGAEAELGFVLARSHWGQGLMTEAVAAVTEWALSSPGIKRTWATCDVDNLASARVLEKAGLVKCGGFERQIVRPNLSSLPRPSLLFEAWNPAA
jgi:RimJ/RimL family protein N-acetyltransferase